MNSMKKSKITINTRINASVEKVWKHWITPEDIIRWNNASDDWHTPRAENDLREGGTFNFRMEAKDGSMGFDLIGVYDKVIPNKLIEYTLGDRRKVNVVFSILCNETEVIETFEAESTHSIEQQREGWQSILNNFKKYVEGNN